MALHWAHTKGFNGTSNSDILYTFLEYGKDSGDFTTKMPKIILSLDNSTSSSSITDCGNIMTTNIPYTYKQTMRFYNDGEYGIQMVQNTKFGWYHGNNQQITNYYDNEDNRLVYDFNNGSGYVYSNGGFRAAGSISADVILANSYIQAAYFNATSDIRAKENIVQITDTVLPLIKNLKLYTYTYKANPNMQSLGIMAQDITSWQFNNFSFIHHPDATGERGDFMGIKENKLVYILFKAVQELADKVDRLEQQLQR